MLEALVAVDDVRRWAQRTFEYDETETPGRSKRTRQAVEAGPRAKSDRRAGEAPRRPAFLHVLAGARGGER
jgi:hypothetical protein